MRGKQHVKNCQKQTCNSCGVERVQSDMELREAGHTQLLANFARFFKAKRDQGSYEVRTFCSSLLAGLYLPSYQHAAGRSCDPGFLGATGGGCDVHSGGGQGEPLRTGPRTPILALRWLPC